MTCALMAAHLSLFTPKKPIDEPSSTAKLAEGFVLARQEIMLPNGSMNSLQILLNKARGSRYSYARRFDFILTYKCGGLYEVSWM